MSNTLRAYTYATIATILVAGSFLASAKLSGAIDPISLTLLRFVVALFFMLPLVLFKPQRFKTVLHLLPKSSIISLFYALYFVAMFKALESTTTLNTGSIYTLTPLLTALLALAVFKERIPPFQLLVYIIGILSTLIVVFRADLTLFLALVLNAGDLIFFLATISMALYSITLKLLFKSSDDIISQVFATLISGSLWMALALYMFDIPLEWHTLSSDLLFAMLYLVVGTTIFTLFLYQKSILLAGPKKIMAFIYTNPALVAIIGYFFEGETLSAGVVGGIVLSVSSTILILGYNDAKKSKI